MKEHVRYILRHFFFSSSNYTLQRGCDSNCRSIPEVHEGHNCKRLHTSSVISADSYHGGSWDLIDKVPVCYAAGALLSVLAHWQWNDRILRSKNAISLSCIWTPFRLHMGTFEVESWCSLAEIISYLFRLAFNRAAAQLQNVKFFPHCHGCCHSFLHNWVTRALLWVARLIESQSVKVTEMIMMMSHRCLKLDSEAVGE